MIGRNLVILGGGVAVVGGIMFQDAQDLKKNYTQVTATIRSVEVDCFVRNGSDKIVKKDTDELAYMDCQMAPFAAKQFGFDEDDVKQRAKVRYEYMSPIDGNYYTGEFTRNNNVEDYADGKEISVFAHKEKPEKSRTPSGNLFLGDDNV